MSKTLNDSLVVTNGNRSSSRDAITAIEMPSFAGDHVLGQTVRRVTTKTLLEIAQQLGSFNLGFSVCCPSFLLCFDLFLKFNVFLFLQKLNTRLRRKLYIKIWSFSLPRFPSLV